jgi:hypothetical protein
MDWCVKPPRDANHPPVAVLNGDDDKKILTIDATVGATVDLSADGSIDLDGDELSYEWFIYPEPSTYRGKVSIDNTSARRVRVNLPADGAGESIHVLLTVRDKGHPPLASYRRVIVSVLGP